VAGKNNRNSDSNKPNNNNNNNGINNNNNASSNNSNAPTRHRLPHPQVRRALCVLKRSLTHKPQPQSPLQRQLQQQ
jgi:hypothetical protein